MKRSLYIKTKSHLDKYYIWSTRKSERVKKVKNQSGFWPLEGENDDFKIHNLQENTHSSEATPWLLAVGGH